VALAVCEKLYARRSGCEDAGVLVWAEPLRLPLPDGKPGAYEAKDETMSAREVMTKDLDRSGKTQRLMVRVGRLLPD
jgi:hypothetical protein